MKMWRSVVRLVKDDRGISSVEYALLLALIGSAIAGAALLLGNQVSSNINDAVTDLGGGAG